MKFTFVGCSFTYGEGLDSQIDSYANIVADAHGASISNLGKPGNSNLNIFLTALNELLFNKPDKLFVQWTSLNRHWFYPGPDCEVALQKIIKEDFQYRDIFFPKNELQMLSNKWHLLNHDYKLILDVIMFCKVLKKIDSRVVFINGLLPWTSEISDTVTNFEQELSDYTKNLLDFENRTDEELHQLLQGLKADKENWVNKYDSMFNNIIDTGSDNQHPGIESHRQYANWITTYLKG